MISIGFDMETRPTPHSSKSSTPQPPQAKPTFLEYCCYCIMPGTTVFGPFISYQTHLGFLNPTPLVCVCVCVLGCLRTEYCIMLVCGVCMHSVNHVCMQLMLTPTYKRKRDVFVCSISVYMHMYVRCAYTSRPHN